MSSYSYTSRRLLSETQVKQRLFRRMMYVHFFLLFCVLIVVARLMELQIFKYEDYLFSARKQQVGTLDLDARRGEIYSLNSKTGELNVLATNSTLDMVYVDPVLVEEPEYIASILTDVLITPSFYDTCSQGEEGCPRELRRYFAELYDISEIIPRINTGALLSTQNQYWKTLDVNIPPYEDLKIMYQQDTENRIAEKRVTNVPLLSEASTEQMDALEGVAILGVDVFREYNYVRANPEEINQSRLEEIATQLSPLVNIDVQTLQQMLRSRDKRYVQIMKRLPSTISSRFQELKKQSARETLARRRLAPSAQDALAIIDPMKSVVLQSENWRYYPDQTIASHIIGFVSNDGEALYGIERSFNARLRGQKGYISTVSDERGRDILTSNQSIVDAKDGDSIVLTIDRFVQKNIEQILEKAVEFYEAESAQAIVMDPFTGKIIAMANAPVFDSSLYAQATRKQPIYLSAQKQKEVVAEVYHPDTKEFVFRQYVDVVSTPEARAELSEEMFQKIEGLEEQYNLLNIARYYIYTGETNRYEVFPTNRPEIWMKYENTIGVGAYKNRTVQDLYEPGSVMKAITMAVALDEGEVVPSDTYLDEGPVEVDEFTIKNALSVYYGLVTMTNCLEQSINTCMMTVSTKLGRRLFYKSLVQFGFNDVTGIELADEQTGRLLKWRDWSNSLLATSGYGQGISTTPLQMTRAFAVLANGGKLMKPYIVDHIVHSDGTIEITKPEVIDQILKPETAETITAMLVSTVNRGPAKSAKVPGYRIAGKTGTSQIPGPSGKYEAGTGSTITSFAGFAPINKPRFVALVKIDRPKTQEFGSKSAAPVFAQIAAFLFEYYGIPPDEY